MRFLQPAIDQHKASGPSEPQYSVDFNGSTTIVNCGSDASLDDLHDDMITVELWLLLNNVTGSPIPISKGTTVGWMFYTYGPTSRLGFYAQCATTDGLAYFDDASLVDSAWHHWVFFYNDAGDRKPYIAVDGAWRSSYSVQQAGVGAVVSDAAVDLLLGLNNDLDGEIAWARISDNDRYNHTTNFTPPAKDNPPATDANTVEQWNLNEGSGTNAAAQVSSPTNDGTITAGSWSSL